MTRYQYEKLAMYRMVIRVMEANAGSWNSLPAMLGAIDALNAKLNTINELVDEQNTIVNGVFERKQALRAEATLLTRLIAGNLFAFAGATDNYELRANSRMTRSRLERASRARFLASLELILNASAEHLNDLGDYGVSQAEVDSLQAMKDELEVLLFATRESILNRKEVTRQISLVMKEADNILKFTMDPMMERFDAEHPSLFTKYHNARRVVHAGTRKRQGSNDEKGVDPPERDDGSSGTSD